MKRKIGILSAGIFFLSVFLNIGLKAQAEQPMVVDNVIKVNPRRPPQASKYYSGTNIKKDKKVKTKMRMIQGWECPSYLHYESKPQIERKKMIHKRRKDLQASKR